MAFKQFSLYLILIFLGLKLSGQELITVFGTISDTSGYSVGFANIAISGTKYGSTADRFGQYSIQIPSGNNTLVITCVGYQNEKIEVFGKSAKKQRIDIVLKSAVEKLEEDKSK